MPKVLSFKKALIQGISMYPTLRTGRKITYVHCTANEIKPGDIILFCIDNKTVCHRVLLKWRAREHVYFLEKGDNPFFVPGNIHSNRLIGKMIAPPPIDWWIVIITTPGVFIGCLLFTIKIFFLKNKKTGIIQQLTKLTKII